MNIWIPKSIALISAFIGVGTIFSEIRDKDSSQSLLPSMSNVFNSKAVTPLEGTCRIWEVEIKQGGYKVTKIVREIKDQNELVNDSGSSSQTFRNEIRDACQGRKGKHVRVGNHVYIYIYKLSGKWIYSRLLQIHDWHTTEGFSDPYRNNR